MEVQKVVPYEVVGESKKGQVKKMFDAIAVKYDLLNHLLSANVDKYWRRRVVSLLKSYEPDTILDVASGTGDLAIAAAQLKPSLIMATDLSEGMLEVAQRKIRSARLEQIIKTRVADGENLPFNENSFDAVTIGFGLRNFGDIVKGVNEFFRVLKPGGVLIILEFSLPSSALIRKFYLFYFRNILPAIGRLISKDKNAYTYLNRSVEAFPSHSQILDILANANFSRTEVMPVTFGISSIYKGIKL